MPVGRHRLYWERYVYVQDDAILDVLTVNVPLDESAIEQAFDYPTAVTFPTAGAWTVDRTESVWKGASLRQPAYSKKNQMEMTLTGPGVLRYCLQIGGDGSNSGLSVSLDSRETFQGWGPRLFK